MILRQLSQTLLQSAQQYPVVTVIGPRQSGKTTLVKSVFSDYAYCSLEDPDIRQFAESDPRAFLSRYKTKVIFDEIQRVPILLSYIQTIVDNEKINGQYILTGSHQLKLRDEISQSLAGRTALLTLLPLSIQEIEQYHYEKGRALEKSVEQRNVLIQKGAYPRAWHENIDTQQLYRNYYQTYVERDVRQLINLKDVSHFEKFLKLLAGRVGQVVNLNSLSNDVGVSSTTLKSWLSVLEASFIIFKLEPYFENFGKRVIKSPKIYFTDTGLLCFLLDIERPNMLNREPLIGGIFENLVILECLKARLNRGLSPNIYFFRDSNGVEVDLLLKQGSQLTPIEIKSASTFAPAFKKHLKIFNKLVPHAQTGAIIYSGEFEVSTDTYHLKHYINTSHLAD